MFLNERRRNHIEVIYYWVEHIGQTWKNNELYSRDWRFYYNFDEGASLTFNTEIWELSSSSYFLIPPFTPMTSHVEPGKNPKQFFIHFRTGEPHNRVARGIYSFLLSSEKKNMINVLMDDLIKSERKGSTEGALSALSLLAQCLIELPKEAFTLRVFDSRIENSIGIMELNLSEPLTVEELSEKAGMSLNNYIRQFKEKVGCTPYRYLTQQRIRKSILLMSDDNLSIEEISERCGYCDRYQFSRMFKKILNISPGEYRMEHFTKV